MHQPLAFPVVSCRGLTAPSHRIADRFAAALLGGAALAGAALLACAIQAWGTGFLPTGLLRLASALAFGLFLLPVLAAGGRLFGSSIRQDQPTAGLLEGLGNLLGNALGALLVAVPVGFLIRLAFSGGAMEAVLSSLAGAKGNLSFEGILLRATLCGGLLAFGLDNWRNGERTLDRIGGFLLATVPMVLWGFSLVAVDLLVLPVALMAEVANGAAASTTLALVPTLLPVVWGNLMGATLVAAFLGKREQLAAASS